MSRLPRRLTAIAVAAATGLASVIVPASPASADDIRSQQWQLGFLRVEEAQRLSQGAGVVVAVIDSGVDATHPDLLGNILPGADVEPGAVGDGRTDTDGHGTAMAGLIAAHGHGAGHASGALGIAPQAKILPVKDGVDAGSALTVGVDWAVAHGASVISISQGNDAEDHLLRRAISNAFAHDIVVVAAAGNLPGTSVDNPAAFPGVVAVAGVDQRGNHADVSITGPQIVLSAPAVGIVHPTVGHGYTTTQGTSDATAIVAGAAALVRSKYPNLSATEVVHRLTATAIDKGTPGRDSVYGYGIVNLVGALTADVPALDAPSSEPARPAVTPERKPVSPWLFVGIGLVLAVVAIVGFAVLRRRSQL